MVSLFSSQIVQLSTDFSQYEDKIIHAFADLTLFINNNMNLGHDLKKDELANMVDAWISKSAGSFIKNTFTSTAVFIGGFVVTMIFTILLLIYRNGLTKAFIEFAPENRKAKVFKMFKNVQQIGSKYLSGMLVVIVIIGFANSIGLLIIGVEHAFLFGFLAATLSFIPYVGTTFGAVLPVIYSFGANDSIWILISIAILFWAVQFLSDNFLTPRIVGGSMEINALTTILSLIVGGMIWGIAGMILFLPFMAMLKIVCEEFDELKPVALLIGRQNIRKPKRHHYIHNWLDRVGERFAKFRGSYQPKKGKLDEGERE
jgi:predicted PurR-regulated permease PerM